MPGIVELSSHSKLMVEHATDGEQAGSSKSFNYQRATSRRSSARKSLEDRKQPSIKDIFAPKKKTPAKKQDIKDDTMETEEHDQSKSIKTEVVEPEVTVAEISSTNETEVSSTEGTFESNATVETEVEDSTLPTESNGHTEDDDTEEVEDLKEENSTEDEMNTSAKDDEEEKKVKDEDELEGKVTKKRRTLDTETIDSPQNRKLKQASKNAPPKCGICRQLLDDPDLRMYQGHPENAVEEFIALVDPRLSLFTGDENDVEAEDERPSNKLTDFSVYDTEGHLCPFDSGLIERNILLYFSGYMKPVYEDNPSIEGGVPTKDMGPINEWWVSGFDGGERALIGFSTGYGDYYLMEPNENYKFFMQEVRLKTFMSKVVIEFLMDSVDPPTYEDLLNKLQTTVPPEGVPSFTEDAILRHAQFVCDQILSFCDGDGMEEKPLITTPCMRSLIKLAGVTFNQRLVMRRTERKIIKVKKPEWTKATTTPLVQAVFENIFPDQLDIKVKGPRRHKCGVCDSCQRSDCGQCSSCKDMPKFGGTGRNKQACIKKKCPNMAIQEAEDSESDDEEVYERKVAMAAKEMEARAPRSAPSPKKDMRSAQWKGEPTSSFMGKTFYDCCEVTTFRGERFTVNKGDFVLLDPNNLSKPPAIGQVKYMYQTEQNQHFHTQIFCRANDTMLGETADPTELFVSKICLDIDSSVVRGKAKATFRPIPENWAQLGGLALPQEEELENDGKTFWYQKRYDEKLARFEDMQPTVMCKVELREDSFCDCCETYFTYMDDNTPQLSSPQETSRKNELSWAEMKWHYVDYYPGTCVFLEADTVEFPMRPIPDGVIANKENRAKLFNQKMVDAKVYPEHYRKSANGGEKCSNELTPDPFQVVRIVSILTRINDLSILTPRNVLLRVAKFYRPENTHRELNLTKRQDLNLLYWSDETDLITLKDVKGKCWVVYEENLEMPLITWAQGGPYRFYFREHYDSVTKTFKEPPRAATLMGKQAKGKAKDKGKVKGKRMPETVEKDPPDTWPAISDKLRCLDVFAGCGGLSEGFHQAGVSESYWAIEKEEAAAHAFKLNNPNCVVFTEDCNDLLRMAMEGEEKNSKGQKLPKKGEVDLLCGGPPCQGFSGMNRFNTKEYSAFKNSLVVSFLSYCDFYRPKFFVLENVRNFVAYKNSMVLKLAMRCLTRMGYQCTFGVLQAGNYGVPQTRRRAILMAAAPGEILPTYPEPTHVFSPKACKLSVLVDNQKFATNCKWNNSAPYRTITVRDAMSDLPEIRNGAKAEEISYGGEPQSYFQKVMRGDQYQPMLRDHICKDMAPLVEARMSHIPLAAGSDWRDLPNIVMRLSDGSFTKQLVYTHYDRKHDRTNVLRGVCPCSTGKPCDPMARQDNTLIPWCLPHTANRYNHWAGLYGRVEWDGFFSTTVTNPEPMGKQGRVVHPSQTRVVSVRECARSQGFPDTYRLYGTIMDKHRQVGNAVPPPMAAAIGHQIRLSIHKKEKMSQEEEEKMSTD